jgi:hypothetical protein
LKEAGDEGRLCADIVTVDVVNLPLPDHRHQRACEKSGLLRFVDKFASSRQRSAAWLTRAASTRT